MARKRDKNHQLAIAARERVGTIIDQIPPEDLIKSIKRAPSLRGMILGYIAEEMFEKYVLASMNTVENIVRPDDHNRTKNKSDRDFSYKGKKYSVQLKSIQTNSITYDLDNNRLEAMVQNDASDSRKVVLPSGKEIITTCYVRGEYDILAVPLFPFTGTWDFAYKWNVNCKSSSFKGYDPEDQKNCWQLSRKSPGLLIIAGLLT